MKPLREDLRALIGDPAKYVSDDRPEMRRMAASLLAQTATDPSVAVMLAGVPADDPQPEVRAAAAEALAGSSDPDPLLEALADPAIEVREAAAYALGEIGDARAVELLMEAATVEADDGVREGAVAALGAIGDLRALPLLIELASSAPPKVRRRTVVALSAFDSPEAITAITAALEDRNPMVKEVAEMIVGNKPEDLPWPTSEPSDN